MDSVTTVSPSDRIETLKIDDADLPPPSPEAEQERNIAVFDLLEANQFRMISADAPRGPYAVTLGAQERRLVVSIVGADGAAHEVALPFSSVRKRAREYFAICDSYFEAVRTRSRDDIAALDEGRKTLHNEGAADLADRLGTEIEIDENTARRLFTLVCSLVYRG